MENGFHHRHWLDFIKTPWPNSPQFRPNQLGLYRFTGNPTRSALCLLAFPCSCRRNRRRTQQAHAPSLLYDALRIQRFRHYHNHHSIHHSPPSASQHHCSIASTVTIFSFFVAGSEVRCIRNSSVILWWQSLRRAILFGRVDGSDFGRGSDGEFNREFAGDGSSAVGEDDFGATHHSRRVRSPSRLVSRWTRPSSVSWCKFILIRFMTL